MSAAITSEALYRDYRDRVEKYIAAHVQNAHDRQDLVQQVFLNAIAALDRYDPARSAVGTWLYAIARNAVVDYYRSKSREPVLAELDETAIPDEEDASLLMREMLDALAAALEQLPERERNIVIWRFYHGISPKEIAERSGISYANVRFLQHSALQKLRRLLEKTTLF